MLFIHTKVRGITTLDFKLLKLKGFVQVLAKYIYKDDMKDGTLILTNE